MSEANGAPVPPEGMDKAAADKAAADRAARQEAADAAYGRAQSAASAAGIDAGKAREAEAEAKKARKEAEAAERAAAKEERAKAKAQKKAEGKGGSFGKSFAGGAAGAICAVVVAGCLCAYTPLGTAFKGTAATNNSGTITVENSDNATLAQAVSAKCINSVVTIYVYSANSSWSQYFNSGSSGSDNSSPNGLGSGVIIKSDSDKSYILTNYHVLEDCSKATVTIDNQTYDCTAVGYDNTADLAVVTIPVGNLTVAEWGDSDSLTVGEWCMAIGSPMGYENTCTAGIVSATGRNGEVQDGSNTYYNSDVIQTDAAINPGNSGGALVNSEGKVIGIVEYLSSNSSSNAGLGFAIPQSTAQKIAETIIDSGKSVSNAYLGISASTADESTDGMQVSAVVKGSPADEAGIEAGDYLTKLGDKEITSYSTLKSALAAYVAGDKVTIEWTHNGNAESKEITLVDSSSVSSSEYSSQLNDENSNSNSGNSGNGSGDSGNSGNSGNDGYSYGYGNYGYSLEDLFNSLQGGNSGQSQSDSGQSQDFWGE